MKLFLQFFHINSLLDLAQYALCGMLEIDFAFFISLLDLTLWRKVENLVQHWILDATCNFIPSSISLKDLLSTEIHVVLRTKKKSKRLTMHFFTFCLFWKMTTPRSVSNEVVD